MTTDWDNDALEEAEPKEKIIFRYSFDYLIFTAS